LLFTLIVNWFCCWCFNLLFITHALRYVCYTACHFRYSLAFRTLNLSLHTILSVKFLYRFVGYWNWLWVCVVCNVPRDVFLQQQDRFTDKKSFHTGTTIAGAIFKVSHSSDCMSVQCERNLLVLCNVMSTIFNAPGDGCNVWILSRCNKTRITCLSVCLRSGEQV